MLQGLDGASEALRDVGIEGVEAVDGFVAFEEELVGGQRHERLGTVTGAEGEVAAGAQVLAGMLGTAAEAVDEPGRGDAE